MKVAIASDHRGYTVKRKVIELIKERGYEIRDFGADNSDPVDYPDFAFLVANAVARNEFDRGILVDGTSIGMCISANKVTGIRAAPCHDDITAELSRRHNDANVLCLSADLLGERLIGRMVEIWLSTDFEGGRHARRVEKIREFEQRGCGDGSDSHASG